MNGTHETRTTEHGTISADVVIVGAGPTGLLLAGDLAAAGIQVTVLEKRPAKISNLTRAFGVHARTLEVLDARGLADELIPTGRKLTQLRLFSSLSLDLSGLPSRFPFLLSTPQYEVEKLLRRRATEHGATFVHDAEVTGVRQDSDGVTVDVESKDGEGSVYRAAYVVGADGVRSAVRKALGQPFPGQSVISSIVLADVLLESEPDLTVAVRGGDGAFGFMIPFGDGYWRVGGWNRERAEIPDDAPTSLDELREIIRRAFGSDFGMHDERWISRFHSDERQVPEYRTGRVFLAGDAAHTHSPAGGQGMNTGLQDANNLGWKLAAVLDGRAPDSLLDSYQAERHPVGRAVLRSSGTIVRVAMAHNPLQLAARWVGSKLLNLAAPVQRKAIGQITGIGYRYAAPRGSHALVGRRARDGVLADGRRLYEALRDGEFVLVAPKDAELPAELAKLAGTACIRVQWRDAGGAAQLVRPDGYVAWARG